MLRYRNQIRLTSDEVAMLTRLTDFVPEGIKHISDLEDYVRHCKRYYWGRSKETRQLHALIDQAIEDCLV